MGQSRNGGPKRTVHMDENAVTVIVNKAFSNYEEKTGLPRHQENLGNFAALFALVNKAKGFAIACGIVVGLPATAASIIVIVKTIRGH